MPALRPVAGLRPLPPLSWRAVLLPLLALLLALAACAPARTPAPDEPFSFAIAHVNDTHSALEPAETGLTLAGRKVRARLGGFARLKTALDEIRAREPNLLVLHAGDAVQGTLYFNVFQGRADFELLNLLGLDAMALGNHEFDKGPELTGQLIDMARFPVLSANIDASAEPALAGRLQASTVKVLGGGSGQPRRVGVVGTTTPYTPNMVASVGRARFLPAAPALAEAAKALRAQGADAVIVLSHNGYDQDLALAASVPGIDAVIGGHSHTLLGDPAALEPLGLSPAGPYPSVVQGPDGRTVLVAQAWRWGMMLGELSLTVTPGRGVTAHSARPQLPAAPDLRADGAPVPQGSAEHQRLLAALAATGVARVIPEDPNLAERLKPYTRQIDAFRNAPVGATASVDFVRETETDPGQLMAGAYLAAVPAAQASLLLPGGVRQDIPQGPISLGQLMAVSPFGNTLVSIALSGAELKNALEDAVEHRLHSRPPARADWSRTPLFFTAGLSCVIDPAQPKGRRVHALRARTAAGVLAPVDPAGVYTLVTNSFLAGGGDSMQTLKQAPGQRLDTGILEHDALADHLKSLHTVQPPAQGNVRVGTAAPPAAVGPEAPRTPPGKVRAHSALPRRNAPAPWAGVSGAIPTPSGMPVAA